MGAVQRNADAYSSSKFQGPNNKVQGTTYQLFISNYHLHTWVDTQEQKHDYVDERE